MIAVERVELQFDTLDSPAGTILVACRGPVVCAVEFADHADRMLAELRARFPNFRRVQTRDRAGICARLGA